MPHLQEKVADDKSRPGSKLYRSSSSEAPITEAKEGFLQATEGLLTIKGMVSAHQHSSSLGPPHAVSEDASSTPRTNTSKQSVITPSPFAGSHHRHRYGPIVTIFGNKKLVPSPIRAKRRASQAEEDCEDGSPEMRRPTNLRYADNYSTPSREVGSSPAVSGDSEPLKKRLLGKLELHSESAKKARVQDCESEDDVETQDDESKETAGSRKPVISPTNSEEGPPSVQRTGFFPPYGAYPQQPYPQPYGNYHHYAAAYHMYSGLPTPHGAHFAGPTGAHSMPHYPSYPPHHYPMMMHPNPSSPHQFSAPQPRVRGMPGPDIMRSSSLPNDEIHSVTDWRRSERSDGRPPSANKCLPLKEPIPSKYWGNAEKTKDVALPDFHRLVNFPDYLIRSRGSDSSQTSDGKKNCVMCGKLRLCTASSLAGRGRTKMTNPPTSDDCSGHIIPRQNKGLCTACDVTVWVVAADGIEIKWCKGCKNFRPWAAFGDKGSATKCGRCRDRQREKYAAQKDELKQPKVKDDMSEQHTECCTHEGDDFGLQTLINAAIV